MLETVTILTIAVSWGIAAALVSQAAIARIMFSMARDHKLPSILRKTHPKYVSTLFVAAISIISTLFFQTQFGLLTSLVNFGAISSFILRL